MTNVDHPDATVPDSVEVPRAGALRYELGFPTLETSQKLFDEMDFQRAVQAYLWGYPAVSFESIRLTAKHDLGIDFNDLGIADNFADPTVRGTFPNAGPANRANSRLATGSAGGGRLSPGPLAERP